MNAVWRTIRGYIWWSYERGSLHYDVMVTLILLFVFLSPYWINFNDKPVERNPHPTGVSVVPDAAGGLIYQIDASAVKAKDKDGLRDELRKIIGDAREAGYAYAREQMEPRICTFAVPVRDTAGCYAAGINVILQGRLMSEEEMAAKFFQPLYRAASELGALLVH